MTKLKLYSLFDAGVSAYVYPQWFEHAAYAIRTVERLVNDTSNENNAVAAHPDQFVLFELGSLDLASGVFTNNPHPVSLGCCIEFVKKVA